VTAVIACTVCTLRSIMPSFEDGIVAHCPRCGEHLRSRKPYPEQRTWALLIAAALLYVPANYFPIMTVTILGKAQSETILSGVEHLYGSGMWEIATVVFFASIVVPLLKIVGLSALLVRLHVDPALGRRERSRLFRVIEYVGRWSMIDMFMLSILVALVRLGEVATIDPGIGATCFAAVVVLTMFAASSFDPRVIWDEGRRPGE